MNALKLKAEFEMQVTKDDLDDILFEALNAGEVAEWADRVVAVGGKLGERICEQISLGGALSIHERIGGAWHELTLEKMKTGIEQYLRESCHVHVEDGRLYGRYDGNRRRLHCAVCDFRRGEVLMTFELKKGMTVTMQPTGNFKRGWDGKPRHGVVEKLGRKYAHVHSMVMGEAYIGSTPGDAGMRRRSGVQRRIRAVPG